VGYDDAGVHGTKRYGASDLELRKRDMLADGIDAEILFPQLGLMIYHRYSLSPRSRGYRSSFIAARAVLTRWCCGVRVVPCTTTRT